MRVVVVSLALRTATVSRHDKRSTANSRGAHSLVPVVVRAAAVRRDRRCDCSKKQPAPGAWGGGGEARDRTPDEPAAPAATAAKTAAVTRRRFCLAASSCAAVSSPTLLCAARDDKGTTTTMSTSDVMERERMGYGKFLNELNAGRVMRLDVFNLQAIGQGTEDEPAQDLLRRRDAEVRHH